MGIARLRALNYWEDRIIIASVNVGSCIFLAHIDVIQDIKKISNVKKMPFASHPPSTGPSSPDNLEDGRSNGNNNTVHNGVASQAGKFCSNVYLKEFSLT